MNTTNKPLTVSAINGMKPGDDLKDSGENTGLRVNSDQSGVKKFYYRYNSPIIKGNKKRVAIGVFVKAVIDENLEPFLGEKLLGLAAARQILAGLKAERKSGICPATRLEKEKAERLSLEASTRLSVHLMVEAYLSQYIEDHKSFDGKLIAGARKVKGQKETRRTLEAVTGKDKPTEFGRRLASDITHVDIKNLITSILANGTPVQAGRVLGELNLAFNYVIGRPEPIKGIPHHQWQEYLPESHVNPCLQAKQYFQNKKIKFSPKKGDRYLSDKEIVKLLEWLPGSKFSPIVRHTLMIVLLTGVRSGEAIAARKDGFDLDKGSWLHDTKMGFKQNTQLSIQAIEYIRPILNNPNNITEYLLPSSRSGLPLWQKQLSEQAWQLKSKGLMPDIEHWTAHDLRRTCRTGLSKLGCPGEIAEAVLGHTKGGIEGVYNLYEYEAECKIWLQNWADHIDVLMGKVTNVVSIKRA
ncbi:MAG: tyrosine-type recombinase/integrase [gamma proteobacterium symbiont of Taylorina sp.]|nr:tyrosine-type recombinase/integrase [gamma proteobacterium symbiont of Taylorina sp.]